MAQFNEKIEISKEHQESRIEKEEKANFIIRYLTKIIPVIERDERAQDIFSKVTSKDKEARESFAKVKRNEEITDEELNYLEEQFLSYTNAEDLNYLLERFETKFFLLEKSPGEYDEKAKKVFLNAPDPASFNTASSLIEQLKKDQRCRAMGLLTDGVAGRDFEDLFKRQPDKVKS